MKSSFGWPVRRVRSHAAFTLIELLTVMAIILVLAGLIINVAGSANYNAAKSRAAGEIKAMETALESYKSDNGAYPPDPFAPTDGSQPTGLLDPQVDFDPTNTKYLNNSEYLYQVLSGFPVQITGMKLPAAASQAMSKSYMVFKPDQLHAASGTIVSPTSSTMYIIDPFGFSYGYSTVYAAMLAAINAAAGGAPAAGTPVNKGYNPTFDLWSTGGYASGGKSTPANLTGTAAQIYSSLWIKNW